MSRLVIVFDILMVNGKSCIDFDLSDRQSIIKRAIQPIMKRVGIHSRPLIYLILI